MNQVENPACFWAILARSAPCFTFGFLCRELHDVLEAVGLTNAIFLDKPIGELVHPEDISLMNSAFENQADSRFVSFVVALCHKT